MGLHSDHNTVYDHLVTITSGRQPTVAQWKMGLSWLAGSYKTE